MRNSYPRRLVSYKMNQKVEIKVLFNEPKFLYEGLQDFYHEDSEEEE